MGPCREQGQGQGQESLRHLTRQSVLRREAPSWLHTCAGLTAQSLLPPGAGATLVGAPGVPVSSVQGRVQGRRRGQQS